MHNRQGSTLYTISCAGNRGRQLLVHEGVPLSRGSLEASVHWLEFEMLQHGVKSWLNTDEECESESLTDSLAWWLSSSLHNTSMRNFVCCQWASATTFVAAQTSVGACFSYASSMYGHARCTCNAALLQLWLWLCVAQMQHKVRFLCLCSCGSKSIDALKHKTVAMWSVQLCVCVCEGVCICLVACTHCTNKLLATHLQRHWNQTAEVAEWQ